MDERYIATVDLGTGKIALTVARILGENIDILFYKEVPSAYVRHSQVVNPMRAAEPLKAVIKEAEEELGIKILQVVIGLPRYSVRQEAAPASTQRSDPSSCITREEVDIIKNMALETYPMEDKENEDIYGAVTQSFETDDMINLPEEDVIGMTSNVLRGNFKIFVGAKRYIHNIDVMLNDAGVAPAKKIFLPDATANAVLSAEEKENGVALIEMGAGVTSLSIYQGGLLRQYSAIPFGGKVITTDIKYICGFKESLAENLKMAFGACMPDRLQSMSEKIIQVNYDEDGTCKQIGVKYMSEIITCRVKEIVEAMLFKIEESGYADKLRNGIVLTGGVANLTGCANYIKELSGYNVRIGYPRCKYISSNEFPGIYETSAAASAGMLMLAKEDPYLNCTTEYVAPKPETPVEEKPEAEAVPEPETEDTVFNPAPAGDKEKAGDAKGGKKNGKTKRPVAPKIPTPVITWGTKLSEKFATLFDGME